MVDWNGISGFTPEKPTEDVDFAPLKGGYVARVDKIERVQGTSDRGNEYDFYSLNLQITETIEGDQGNNRYLRKTYSAIDGAFSTAEENLKRLVQDLFTAGIEVDKSSQESFDASLANAKDKLVHVRCWHKKNKEDNAIQYVKVVKELNVKDDGKAKKDADF